MNTQSIAIPAPPIRAKRNSRKPGLRPMDYSARLARWTLAFVVASAVMIPGIWAALTPEMGQYLSALLWGGGFLFFAVALGANIRRVMPVVGTGLALPVLAILGSRVAEEFSVLAVAWVAAWLATWIVRRKNSATLDSE